MRIFNTIIVLFLLVLFGNAAHAAADISIGTAISDLLNNVVIPVVTAAISALIGWVAIVIKKKFNVDIESQYRDALSTFLQRQASSLIASGAVRLNGLKITVQNDSLAAAANAGLVAIPQVMGYFNLTEAHIAKMIVDLIPKQPAVAQAAAVALDAANPATPSKLTPTAG